MIAAQWNRRIRRANELTSCYPFAAEGLRFYARVAAFQQSLYSEMQQSSAGSPRVSASRLLREDLDLLFLLPKFSGFLSLIQQSAPAPVAQAAGRLAQKGPENWARPLEQFWRKEAAWPADIGGSENDQASDPEAAVLLERLLAWIFLQPYAEYLADRLRTTSIDGTPSTCPLCGAKPIVGVLRQEGDGAKKSLICMLCAHEWSFRRIYCPACGEEREPQMAFYSTPEITHVRVDVCDTCHTYLKSIDLTKTGLAVPVVDELATIPLDLWAREHGYEKLQINLLGT
jgi:formate dehydrogenase maturation protein FdhE